MFIFNNICAKANFFKKPLQLLVLLGFLISLAGCSNSLQSPLSLISNPAADTTGSIKQAKGKLLYFEPVTGVPANISTQLRSALITEAKKQKIAITNNPKAASHKVHSYLLTDTNGSKRSVNYIIDVNDQVGQRKARVMGDMDLGKSSSKNVWSAVTPSVTNKIAAITGKRLARWQPKQTRGKRAAVEPTVQKPRKIKTASKPKHAPLTTGSVNTGVVLARVVPLSGAPGDGRIALANAIRSELGKNGVKTISSAAKSTHTITGNVKKTKIEGGQEKIEIIWKVLDKAGNPLGTIHQSNNIPQGALDQRWGNTAKAAASAAAGGIVKLLDEQKKKKKI